MSECTNKRLREKLYAYELGVLPAEDVRQMELHLMDCPACLAEVREFARTTRLLRHDRKVRQAVGRLDRRGGRSWRVSGLWHRWRSWAPAAAMVALLLMAMVLKDWQFEVRPSHQVRAAEGRVVVMSFESLGLAADSGGWGGVVANLVIADLAQAEYLQVVSSSRVTDLRRLLARTGDSTAGAISVARRAEAQWVISGTVTASNDSLVLTAELVEVGPERVAGAYWLAGSRAAGLFVMVDSLTVLMRKDLPLAPPAARQADLRVSQITTPSVRAYRYYLDGIDYQTAHQNGRAIEAFETALTYDSTLAMAWYHLAGLKDRQLIERALIYSDRLSPGERLYIYSRAAAVKGDYQATVNYLTRLIELHPDEKNALSSLAYYHFLRFEIDKSIAYLERAITIDPLYRGAYELLVRAYDEADDFENALRTINTYIDLVPGEAAAYATRGYLYAAHGQLDQAIESYQAASELRQSYWYAIEQLGNLTLFKGEFERAGWYYDQLVESNRLAYRARGRYYRAVTFLQQGRFDDARRLLDTAIAHDRVDSTITQMSANLAVQSRIYAERSEWAEALRANDQARAARQLVHPEDSGRINQFGVLLLAEAGLMDSARAVLTTLQARAEMSDRDHSAWQMAAGAVQLMAGNYAKAILSLEQAVVVSADFPTRYLLARAYHRDGQLSKAVKEYEDLTATYSEWRLCWSIWSTKLYYHLGVAYEQSNWNDEAVRQYERFLKQWQQADPEIPELEDARRRLAHLKAS